MNNNINEVKENIIEEQQPKKRVIKFNKPYTFECQSYKEIDLSGLEDLTTDDLMTAERIYLRTGGSALNPETTLMYSVILAHLVSHLPIEFFGKLPAKESSKIKLEVYDFFYREG